MKFRLKGGTHADGRPPDWKLYKKGDTVESNLDLEKLFPNKFDPILEAPQAPSPVPPTRSRPKQEVAVESSVAVVEPPEEEEDEEEDELSLGRNVSDQFAKAEKVGLLIFLGDDGKYGIADPAFPKVNMARNRLDKAQVKKFLVAQLMQQD